MLLVVLASLGLWAGGAAAQEIQRPFGVIAKDWNQSLDLIDQELGRRPVLSADRLETLKRRLAKA